MLSVESKRMKENLAVIASATNVGKALQIHRQPTASSNQSAFLCCLTFDRLLGSPPPLRPRCSSTALNMLGVASSRIAALIAGITSAHMPELKAEYSSHMLRTN